ncbi:hypothetical protein [Polaribacter sp. IC073]|uniref:hypothetical protein n=1 Tax=Polaribacter sp. IC073 TaxID=2508540 RepID=UPI0011BF0371|nr:hypothetical protein [Polaribacter sp. IC073]TXD47350.1 hypothetical protein ES045_12190 [Polaribacter sp. IC073]
MTKKELLAKYRPYPTYTAIAKEAFELGLKIGEETNQTDKAKKDAIELMKVKAELKHLWETLEDPEKCVELICGM